MRKRNPHIARALFWDALILLALSVYELCVRLDSSWGWAKGYFLSHLEARTPLSIIVKHIPYHNLGVWMYMLGCALLALWALLSPRTRRVCAFLLPPAAALTALGFALRLTIFGELIRMLKLLPLVILLLLCLMHVLLRPARKRPENQPGFPPERHRRSERHRAA